MHNIFLSLVSLLLSISTFAQSYTVKTVPNPKDKGNYYVSNPDQILSSDEESMLNTMMDSLENQTTNQVAIVVLKSIGDEVPKDFATNLFKEWGIGLKGKDNGLLVLFVLDQRRIEMETGYGMEPILTDGVCKIIQLEEMIPSFKNEAYGEGIIKGMERVNAILRDPENKALVASYVEEENVDMTAEERDAVLFFMGFFHILILLIVFFVKRHACSFAHLYKNAPSDKKSKINEYPISVGRWLLVYVLLPLVLYFGISIFSVDGFFIPLFIALYIYLGFVFVEQKLRKSQQVLKVSDDLEKYHNLYSLNKMVVFSVLFFPLPFLFYFFWYKNKKNILRNHARNCPECSKQMVKLDEVKDDEYLTKNQIKEESLKSVDYDAWLCSSCNHHTVLAYKNLSTSYTLCAKCNTVAMGFLKKNTIRAATYSSSGRGEKIFECKNCNHKKKESYTIAQLERSSSSSSSSSSSDSGSWGGGSSGGGGSGSSW